MPIWMSQHLDQSSFRKILLDSLCEESWFIRVNQLRRCQLKNFFLNESVEMTLD